MQNKAVVNEQKANDVNLLREQIRQLKVWTHPPLQNLHRSSLSTSILQCQVSNVFTLLTMIKRLVWKFNPPVCMPADLH